MRYDGVEWYVCTGGWFSLCCIISRSLKIVARFYFIFLSLSRALSFLSSIPVSQHLDLKKKKKDGTTAAAYLRCIKYPLTKEKMQSLAFLHVEAEMINIFIRIGRKEKRGSFLMIRVTGHTFRVRVEQQKKKEKGKIPFFNRLTRFFLDRFNYRSLEN